MPIKAFCGKLMAITDGPSLMDHHRHVWSYPMQFKKNSMQMVVPGPAFLTLGFHILYYILHDLFAKHCAKLMLHTYSIKLMRTWVQMMMKKKHTIFSSFSQHNSQKTVRVGFEL